MNTTEYGPETAATGATGVAGFHGRGRFHPARTRRVRLCSLIALWYRRWEQRSALAALDGHLLRDIGKTRNQALHEAAKPFWRP